MADYYLGHRVALLSPRALTAVTLIVEHGVPLSEALPWIVGGDAAEVRFIAGRILQRRAEGRSPERPYYGAVISWGAETWEVLNAGRRLGDGTIYTHLAHATDGALNRVGVYVPRQIADWVPEGVLKAAVEREGGLWYPRMLTRC